MRAANSTARHLRQDSWWLTSPARLSPASATVACLTWPHVRMDGGQNHCFRRGMRWRAAAAQRSCSQRTHGSGRQVVGMGGRERGRPHRSVLYPPGFGPAMPQSWLRGGRWMVIQLEVISSPLTGRRRRSAPRAADQRDSQWKASSPGGRSPEAR